MSTLREVQADLRAALLGGPAGPAAAVVLEEGLAAEARLAIYRHHVFATLTDVLKASYPVVCRLVDERFFAYAADQYIRHHPPTGPCIFKYGEGSPTSSPRSRPAAIWSTCPTWRGWSGR